MSAKLLPTAAAASASSSASAFPPAAQMVYDVLRALPEGSQPSTTDLWHAVHARFPSDPDAPPLQAMPPRFTLKPVEPRFARPYPNHPFGSKSCVSTPVPRFPARIGRSTSALFSSALPSHAALASSALILRPP